MFFRPRGFTPFAGKLEAGDAGLYRYPLYPGGFPP